MGGMVLETTLSEIITHVDAQFKLEKAEVGLGHTLSHDMIVVIFNEMSFPIIENIYRIAVCELDFCPLLDANSHLRPRRFSALPTCQFVMERSLNLIWFVSL